IWNHHPLSNYAIVDRVYIDGQKYYDRQEDQKRLTELAREKESLVNAEKGERRAPTTTENPAPRAEEPVAGTTGTSGARRLSAPEREGVQASVERSARVALQTRGVLAITNARIVPVAKPTIERGTIVVRDAIIESVGANVSVPSGAQVIDAAGAEVYPGFI